MKKLISVLLSVLLLSCNTAFATDLSDWAKDGFIKASSAGLISYNVVSNNLKSNITREEFCELAVNLYSRLTYDDLLQTEVLPFGDSDSMFVAQAYKLGIVSGDVDGNFYPDRLVKREEMAKMILKTLDASDVGAYLSEKEKECINKYDDNKQISEWAKEPVATMLKYGLINGITDKIIEPKGNATREQAITISNRTYIAFAKNTKNFDAPKVNTPSNNQAVFGDVNVSWDKVYGANEYNVILKDKNGVSVFSINTKGTSITIDKTKFTDNKYTIIVGTKQGDVQVFSLPVDFSYTSQPLIPNSKPATTQKEKKVFPDGTYFASEEEADKYMDKVIVDVWNINSKGEKVASKSTIVVNENLSGDVQAIFSEIFNGEEKFPIYSVGGYTWRKSATGNLSQHSYGTCIDINPNENYYISSIGTVICGTHWNPNDDPYSISEYGEVVRIFAKYGWAWGGNAWKSSKDYMHFTYLGG